MKPILPAALVIPFLALAACTSTSSDVNNTTSSTPSVSSVPMQETQNVTYQGTMQAAGASIFMEGTNKLQLEDGRFIMLESTDIDLDSYIGKKVEVFGAVRPTTEAGGMIMRVQRVTSLESSSSSSEESSASGSSLSSSSALTSSESSVSSTAKSSVQSSLKVSLVSVSSAVSSSSAIASSVASVAMATSSSNTYEGSAELTDKAAIMAKDNMAANLWTQQYCSKTAAFCFAVHKNWYFTSFGATASTLWHVEVGPQTVNNIGEGPLSVNLVSGSLASTGMADGQVQASNGSVVGYKEWTENRHFEIRGPANLQTAITYMLSTLKPN